MAKHLRLKKMINWTVQGPIIGRLLAHFLCYNAATLFLLLTVWGIKSALASIADKPSVPEPMTFWQQAGPVLVCMAVMTPFMVWDLMKLTNRIAGPLYRFETLLKEFNANGTLKPAVLRDGDLLVDFQKHFNEFAMKLHTLYPETKPVSGDAATFTKGGSAQPLSVETAASNNVPLRIIG